MLFTRFVAVYLTALTGLVTAQSTKHIVYVAENGFNFSPSQLTAEVGDIVEFQFYPLNHSIARASFGVTPCIPYEYSSNKTGFFSGFKPVNLTLESQLPTWSVTINDTEPIFYYCGAPTSCQNGMVGVINPNATFTFDQQLAWAQNTSLEFSPGEPYPSEGEIKSVTRITTVTGDSFTPTALSSFPTSTSAVTTTSASSTPSTSPTTAPISTQSQTAISTGAIVGIAVGGLVVALLVGVIFYMCGRQRTVNDLLRQQQIGTNGPKQDAYQPSSPGVSEVYYSNMPKLAGRNSMRFSGRTYNPSEFADTSSYRSRSPPIDERTSMIASTMGISALSPTSGNAPSPGHPSSTYWPHNQYEPPILPQGQNRGPHELPAKHDEKVENRES